MTLTEMIGRITNLVSDDGGVMWYEPTINVIQFGIVAFVMRCLWWGVGWRKLYEYQASCPTCGRQTNG